MTETNAVFQSVKTETNSETLLGDYQKALYEYNVLHTSYEALKAEKEKMAASLKGNSETKHAAELDAYKAVHDRFAAAEGKVNAAGVKCRQAGDKAKELLHDFPDMAFEFNVTRTGVGGLTVADTFSITLTHGELVLIPVQKNAN